MQVAISNSDAKICTFVFTIFFFCVEEKVEKTYKVWFHCVSRKDVIGDILKNTPKTVSVLFFISENLNYHHVILIGGLRIHT